MIRGRCNYLRKIRKFREDVYEIVYLDETWLIRIMPLTTCGYQLMVLMPQRSLQEKVKG